MSSGVAEAEAETEGELFEEAVEEADGCEDEVLGPLFFFSILSGNMFDGGMNHLVADSAALLGVLFREASPPPTPPA